MKFASEIQNELLSAKSYRSFLRVFFNSSGGQRPLTYGEFAQRAGFKSRTFMNDVILGRKRLTPLSIEQVKVGLRLTGAWADYLHCLVAMDEPKFQTSSRDQKYYLERLKKKKLALQARSKQKNGGTDDAIAKILLQPNFPEMFAALGTFDAGADFETILSRTKFEKTVAISLLGKLIEAEIVELKNGRYYATEDSLQLEMLGSSEYLRADFFRSVDKAKRRFEKQAAAQKSLFMNQTFLVSEKDLRALREQVFELLKDFVASNEQAEGDTIAELTVAFTHHE